jgi:beta-glucosidase
MPKATYHFPKGFLWGCATAAQQCEGQNTNNNWHAWESQPGRIKDGDTAGLACDWWGGRWKEDFDRAKDAGQNAMRISVEWSRIQPEPDRWDEDAIDHYRQMVRGLVDRGMMPYVTLHHFSDPLWLSEKGGWEQDDAPERFAIFVRKIVEALKEYVTLWCTINEPNVYTWGAYISGDFPPGKANLRTAFKVLGNLLRGHALAYKTIHEMQKEARVGLALHYRGFRPARTWFGPDKWLAKLLTANMNEAFPQAIRTGRLNFAFQSMRVPEAVGSMDYFGLNYYTVDLVKLDLTRPGDFFSKRYYPEGAVKSDDDYIANVPKGLFDAIKWSKNYGVPVIISENGVNDRDDRMRPQYIVEHIHQIWRAINFNWPVKGYFHWSLVDNFEWERGWSQRFGLWGLDTQTQARIRRPSVDLYASICKTNAITHDAVEKYAPAAIPQLYPE